MAALRERWHPDIASCLLTTTGFVVVLYRGVWTPVNQLPKELQALAVIHAKPVALIREEKQDEPVKAEVLQPENIPVEKFEENCPEVKKQGKDCEKVKEPHPLTFVDPTGTPAPQMCMGCGYKATLPYPACCPTCRNPYPVSMVLCMLWPDLLRHTLELSQVQKEDEPPVVKLKQGQLSLFGAIA